MSFLPPCLARREYFSLCDMGNMFFPLISQQWPRGSALCRLSLVDANRPTRHVTFLQGRMKIYWFTGQIICFSCASFTCSSGREPRGGFLGGEEPETEKNLGGEWMNCHSTTSQVLLLTVRQCPNKRWRYSLLSQEHGGRWESSRKVATATDNSGEPLKITLQLCTWRVHAQLCQFMSKLWAALLLAIFQNS